MSQYYNEEISKFTLGFSYKTPIEDPIRITCLSDLHGYLPQTPGGDLLILAGDYTRSDKMIEWGAFMNWLLKQNYRKKVLIGGNHDNFLYTGFPHDQKQANELDEINAWLIEELEQEKEDFDYLCNSGIEWEGIKIWGSPWTCKFEGMNPRCKAFTLDSDDELEDRFSECPMDTHILITHCAPHGIFDSNQRGECLGSPALRRLISMVDPKLCVFGHIHEWGGNLINLGKTICVNASYLDEEYQPENNVVHLTLSKKDLIKEKE